MAGVLSIEVSGKKLYDAASKGDVKAFQELLDQDPHLLDLVSFPCSRNLLHIATMQRQACIVEEVMKRNAQLSRDLDSQKSSPLHIAAARGHVEIASKLLVRAPEMCWWRDCQGMNPVHIAAMNGHAEVLKMMIGVDPFPAKERVGRGQTAAHLCVKHRQLRALEVLVENLGELVRAEDDDGETVLHLAVRYKQVEIIRYLVVSNKIDKKARNSKGKTALQILQESFPHSSTSSEMREMRKVLIGRITFTRASDEILKKLSDAVMVVVVLIATMAFQAAVSPPGGVWQDDSTPHKAGEAVMASNRPKLYKNFVRANTTAFVSALITIFLLTTGLPSENPIFTNFVIYTMWVSLTSIGVSYGASIMVITPNMESQSLDHVIETVIVVSLSLFGIVFVLNNLWGLCSRVKNVMCQVSLLGE